jgi:DNA polymerase III epsilon subunit-like protein
MKNILALDVETTGLRAGYHEIIQIGAIFLNGQLDEIATFQSLVRPVYPKRGYHKRDKEIFSVYEYTGISEEDVSSAPELKQVLEKLVKWTKKHHGNLTEITILGQNTRFDMSFLEASFKKIKQEFPFDYHCLDLVTLYTAYSLIHYGRLPDTVKLKDICKQMGATLPDGTWVFGHAHHALHDARMTWCMFRQIIGRLREVYR